MGEASAFKLIFITAYESLGTASPLTKLTPLTEISKVLIDESIAIIIKVIAAFFSRGLDTTAVHLTELTDLYPHTANPSLFGVTVQRIDVCVFIDEAIAVLITVITAFSLGLDQFITA